MTAIKQLWWSVMRKLCQNFFILIFFNLTFNYVRIEDRWHGAQEPFYFLHWIEKHLYTLFLQIGDIFLTLLNVFRNIRNSSKHSRWKKCTKQFLHCHKNQICWVVMSVFNTVQNVSIILKWHSVSQRQRRNDVKIIDIPQSLIVHIHIKKPN